MGDPKTPNALATLRKYFITGLATILPLGLTYLIFSFLVSRLGNTIRPLLDRSPLLSRLPEWVLTLIGFVLVLVFVLAVGALASGIIGRWVVGWLDRLLRRVPLVKGIYGSARQLTEAVFIKKSSLRRTVIAEYPRRGLLAIGFVTTEQRIELNDGRKAVFVYFPTTPNPTSGWLALIPEADLTETTLTTDVGLRLVVSGGVVLPEGFAVSVQAAALVDESKTAGPPEDRPPAT